MLNGVVKKYCCKLGTGPLPSRKETSQSSRAFIFRLTVVVLPCQISVRHFLLPSMLPWQGRQRAEQTIHPSLTNGDRSDPAVDPIVVHRAVERPEGRPGGPPGRQRLGLAGPTTRRSIRRYHDHLIPAGANNDEWRWQRDGSSRVRMGQGRWRRRRASRKRRGRQHPSSSSVRLPRHHRQRGPPGQGKSQSKLALA